jgi:hypothetical protein
LRRQLVKEFGSRMHGSEVIMNCTAFDKRALVGHDSEVMFHDSLVPI